MIILERYDYAAAEKKWQQYWEEHGTFKAEQAVKSLNFTLWWNSRIPRVMVCTWVT